MLTNALARLPVTRTFGSRSGKIIWADAETVGISRV